MRTLPSAPRMTTSAASPGRTPGVLGDERALDEAHGRALGVGNHQVGRLALELALAPQQVRQPPVRAKLREPGPVRAVREPPDVPTVSVSKVDLHLPVGA